MTQETVGTSSLIVLSLFPNQKDWMVLKVLENTCEASVSEHRPYLCVPGRKTAGITFWSITRGQSYFSTSLSKFL